MRIEGVGNMVGFSPVTLCVDVEHGGETAWIKTELVRGSQLEPWGIVTTTEKASRRK